MNAVEHTTQDYVLIVEDSDVDFEFIERAL